MNRRVVLFHLSEAAEELSRTITELARKRNFSEGAFELAMGHAYHHLNTAWNGRNQTDKQFRDCTDGDFQRFRKFPKESEFVYLDTEASKPAARGKRLAEPFRPVGKPIKADRRKTR